MIGSRVKFKIQEYSKEHGCQIVRYGEGVILDKYSSPLKVFNEGVRGMTEANLKVYIPADYYLIINTIECKLYSILCSNVEEIISHKHL